MIHSNTFEIDLNDRKNKNSVSDKITKNNGTYQGNKSFMTFIFDATIIAIERDFSKVFVSGSQQLLL